jgi:chromosome partitioning protein
MKTIVFAGTKGGAGKTTLAFNVAIEAAKTESVFLADMDPQRSLETFAERRPGDNPALIRDVKSLKQTVSDLKKTGEGRAYLIVDSPGSFMKIVRDAIAAADCVVVPVRPSPLDILASEDITPILNEFGKMAITIPVINCVDTRTSHKDFIDRIGEMFTRKPVLVRSRFAYARALIGSLAGFEIDRHCEPEIVSLWHQIKTVTRTSP